MGVQSYLALYTMLLGWQQYQALWSIMVDTGLMYLPFGFLIIKYGLSAATAGDSVNAAKMAVKKIVLGIVGGVFIITIAGVPVVQINPDVLTYHNPCGPAGNEAKPGNTGTTYDASMPIPTEVKVPMLWYLAMAISNGVTDSAISGLSCPTVDLRTLQENLSLTTIQDPTLKSEAEQFARDCYSPAYSRYMDNAETPTEQQQIQQALQTYGSDDISWIGSETFVNVTGFYDSYSATSPIPGFPFDPSRDQEEGQIGTPQWGEPDCKTWWTDPQNGLKTKLFSQYSADTQSQIAQIGQNQLALAQDAAIRVMLSKSGTQGGFITEAYQDQEDNRTGWKDTAAKYVGDLFVDEHALFEYPKLHILMNALPIVQAVLSFALYALLAIGLPLAGYSLGFCCTASVMIFSLTFMSFLWQLVTWLDQFLMQALYGYSAGQNSMGWLYNLAQSISPASTLLDITVSMMYVIIPMFWLGITGWASYKVGGMVDTRLAEGMAGNAAKGGAAKAIFGALL